MPCIRPSNGSGHEFCEKLTKVRKGIIVGGGTHLLHNIVHVRQDAIIFQKRENGSRKILSQTKCPFITTRRENESHDDHMDRHERVEPVDYCDPDRDGRGNVSVANQSDRNS